MNLFEKAKQLLSKPPAKAQATPAETPTAIPQAWLDAAQAEVGSLLSREEVEQARQAETSHDVDMVALREALLNETNVEQLATLAAQIGLAPSQLFGGKGRKVMGLLQSAEKNGLVTELLSACQTTMPDVDWQ